MSDQRDIEDKLETPPDRKLYTRKHSGSCVDDPKGDVIIRSKDGYTWRVKSTSLKAASSVFDDMLGDNTLHHSVINLDDSGGGVHALLYFITRHHLEVFPGSQVQCFMTNELQTVIPLLEKYQCDTHLKLLEIQAVQILYHGGPPATVFRLACRRGWPKVGKMAIREFWEWMRMDPEDWSEKEIEAAGAKGYRGFVIACATVRKEMRIEKLGCDTESKKYWERAAELFELN